MKKAREPAVIGLEGLAERLGVSVAKLRRLRVGGAILKPRFPLGHPDWLEDEVNDWLAAGMPGATRWEQIKGERREKATAE